MPDSITAGFTGGFKNSQNTWRRRLIAFHNTATAGDELSQLVRQTHLWGVTNNDSIIRDPSGPDGSGVISGSAVPGTYVRLVDDAGGPAGTFTGWRAFTEKWAKGAVLSNFDGIMVHNPFGTCQSVKIDALYDTNGRSNGGRRDYGAYNANGVFTTEPPTPAEDGKFRDFTTTTNRNGATSDAYGFSEQQMQLDAYMRVKEQNPELSWVSDIVEFESAWTSFFEWRATKAGEFPNDQRYTRHFEVIAYVGTMPEYYNGMINSDPGIPSYATTPLFGEEWEWKRWLATDYAWSTLFNDPAYSTGHNASYWRTIGIIREIRQSLLPFIKAGFTGIGFDAACNIQEEDPRMKVWRWLQQEKGMWVGVESPARNSTRNQWLDNSINLTEQTTQEDNEIWDSAANGYAYYTDPTQFPFPRRSEIIEMFSRTEDLYNGSHNSIPWPQSKYTKVTKELNETPTAVSNGIRYQFTITHASLGSCPISVGDIVRLEQNTDSWVNAGYGHIESASLSTGPTSTTSQITVIGFFDTISNFLVDTWRIVNVSVESAATIYYNSVQLYPISAMTNTEVVSWKDVPGLWGEYQVMINTAAVWNVHTGEWVGTQPGWVPGCTGWADSDATNGNQWSTGILPPIDFNSSANPVGTGWGQVFIRNEVIAKYRSVLLPSTYYVNAGYDVRDKLNLEAYPAFQVPESSRILPNAVRRTDLSYIKPS